MRTLTDASDCCLGLNVFSLTLVVFSDCRLCSWFIIVKDVIPISLYVSLELVQFCQALFISWDREIVATIDGQEYRASVQTSKLNEELAQVAYIFSDKVSNKHMHTRMAIERRSRSRSTSPSHSPAVCCASMVRPAR